MAGTQGLSKCELFLVYVMIVSNSITISRSFTFLLVFSSKLKLLSFVFMGIRGG